MNKEAGRATLAERHYLEALKLTPDDADLHLQLGHFFKTDGRRHEAIAFYENAARLRPGWPAPLAELLTIRAPSTLSIPKAVFMVDAFYPRPDSDSGSIDQIMYIKMFQGLGYTVYFAADRELALQSKYRQDLEAMNVRCVVYPEYETIGAFLVAYASEIALCFLSRVDFGAHHLETARRTCPHAKIIFNAVDLHYVREQREADLKNDELGRLKAEETRKVELNAVIYSDATIVVSEYEAELLRQATPDAKIYMIPLIRDYTTGRRAGFTERLGIGFIGGYHHLPNVDAVEFFLDEIWPLVRIQLPEAEFFVIGSNLPNKLAARRDVGVQWVGHVPDIEPWLTRLRLMVAPLRYGAGAKGKVVSSLAYGVPCIVSPIAAEGMGLKQGVQVEVGQTPQEFADHVVDVYTDSERWLRLSEAGIVTVNENYSMQNGITLLQSVIRDLIS